MGFEKFLFYVFALILIFAAVRVITVRNSVHAALFLVLAFFTSAALWLLIEAEFLAITMVLVYVGAVMVLFLFVVMMLDLNTQPLREGFIKYLPVGATVAVIIVIEMVLALGSGYFSSESYSLVARSADYSNTKELGSVLYTFYVYPFEIASVILLVAIIAAISLTLRRREGTKSQNPSHQVLVSRDDRIRLVNVPAEKKH
ncbi:NADH-ubiquinone/plastoquinone oxidoreductase chain 6 [Candidatus Competibacter denitrificans Run_A_D11]|uniref:NADH-quinone oxidoreductase subunit J n=1 Tax=Candidatus Competibacter denitrificans Run_A_D11 TaxID=1400863 RepID=W6MDM2_9GAMM|nr:NADH-quinone oxidoreductase subunit J [Candidatus Competibacter denitrificans]CDI03108.1 NADH-ubiquinone/plastoquinone oxidoreductase chain 6 [Candidatus Competibacter denitrificans Run_A_D11]HAS86552.1 NADH-quinone oxidoreductase subunit J [Candidatus Competibacteraceae bacterium]HRC68776.1 NADH-quinone oxidoreductase subunit J [Candidatus Competibacter denitrificans]